VGMVSMGLLFRWSAGHVAQNLDVLRTGVQAVRGGHWDRKLPPAPHQDETADVIDAFNAMVGELDGYFKRTQELTRKQERIDTELDLARNIQKSILPGEIHPPGGEIANAFHPAQQVGGDFYDFFTLAGGRTALAIGDVSGKGISAAMFMVRACLLLRGAAATFSPADAVSHTNAMLSKANDDLMFVTLFFAVWDPATQSLTCVNAGHNPPFLLGADGEIRRLAQRGGPALGVQPGHSYTEYETRFAENDFLAVYTDGITEAPDPSGEQFGEARLVEFLRAHSTGDLSAAAERLVGEVLAWQGGQEQFDDITLLFARAGAPPCGIRNPASVQTIEGTVDLVVAEALRGGMAAPAANEIGLAVCEAVTNTITYALSENPTLFYRVTASWSGDFLVVRIEDTGPPFDPDALPPANVQLALEERKIGGLGWFLIRQATDAISMDRIADTNVLTLLRHRDRLTIGQKKKLAS